MNSTKKWYESKGVWANILSFATMMLAMFGLIDTDQGKIIVEQGTEMVTALIVAVLNLLGLYGRITAKDVISNATVNSSNVDATSVSNSNSVIKPLG